MKKFRILSLFLLSIILIPSCTDLGEEAFSVIPSDKYYTDKNSVNAAVLRPYEHGHWCAWDGDRWLLQELTGDHFVWTQKGKHGWDEGQWVRLHKHNWDYLQNQVYGSWTGPYQGIGYINNTLNDFNTMDLSSIITEQEKKAYIAELRVLRVWYYSFLIDFFRNIPISEDNLTIKEQSTPQEVFDYMEKELKDVGTQSVHETEEEMYKIEYEGGSISVTGNHPIWSVTRNAYIRADDIQEDEEVMIDA